MALGSSEKLIKKTDALHYPTDLNPFGEEEEETNMKQNTTHSSLNPFGSDTDENEAEIPTVTRGKNYTSSI